MSYSDEKIVEQLEIDLIEAFRKSDIKELNRILADEFIITDPNGPSFTKAAYLAGMASGKISFEYLAINQLEVRINDDIAVVSGKATAKGRSEKGSYNGQYSFTDVYVKRQGYWQAILSAVNREKIAS
ncbi:MAG: nuclear transport factor 2 family protein [Acidobacteriota bacterium]